MKVSTFFVIAVLGLGVVAVTSVAHHSTIDIYDDEQTVEVTGVVKEWRFVNPHPFLIVEVEGENGETEDWDLSFGGSAASALARSRGYTADTFKVGDIIIASGAPARSEEAHGLLVSGRGGVRRADGTSIP
jgi:hypothetical protein